MRCNIDFNTLVEGNRDTNVGVHVMSQYVLQLNNVTNITYHTNKKKKIQNDLEKFTGSIKCILFTNE